MIKIINLAIWHGESHAVSRISCRSGQGQGTGILGMTFDPNYATNGHFYVARPATGTELSEAAFPISPASP